MSLLNHLDAVGLGLAARQSPEAAAPQWDLYSFGIQVPKNHTVVYETAGDNVKITVDGTDKDGKSTHNEWTGKFDGKDYPVTGDPTSDIRSYEKVGDRALKMKIKKDGKVTIKGRIIVSADGKTRIVITGETGAKGKGFRNRSVYDKQ